MDFDSVLKVAASKQAEGGVKRYSLAVGPPKKVPKVKGVQSKAVQAFLKKKEEERRLQELEEKKKKEELLAKRKELKHDKKARAMASRTKDNFRGYNGIPIIEDRPKKRHSSPQGDPNANGGSDDYMTEEERYEYSQTESEEEEEPEPPPKKMAKSSSVRKGAPPAMNFAELLQLAQKKQFEPVEIVKPVKKSDERPRTAEELRELEFLERKTHKGEKRTLEKDVKRNGQIVKVSKSSGDKHSSTKGSHSGDGKSKSQDKKSSTFSKSGSSEKVKNGHNGTIKRSSGDGGNRTEKSMSSSHSKASKAPANGSLKSPSVREHGVKHSSSRPESMGSVIGKSQGSARPSSATNPARPSGSSGTGSGRPSSSGSTRPSGGSVSTSARPSSGSSVSTSARPSSGSSVSTSARPSSGSSVSTSARPSSGSSVSTSARPSSGSSSSMRPTGGSSSIRPSGNSGSLRPSGSSGLASSRPSAVGHSNISSGSSRPPGVSGSSKPNGGAPLLGSTPKTALSRQAPGSSSVRPGSGLGPGRPINGASGVHGFPSKPKCTVIAETISSKNFIPKSNNGQINGMRPAQAPGPRPMMRPPGPPRPPIDISYKRRIDDEEEDSEMEDFIDDGGECQEEISKHIREIFGYDKNKYKDESDYALRYMETNFRELQKEEARSLRLGIQEDLEELRREEEELKMKAKREKAKRMKTR